MTLCKRCKGKPPRQCTNRRLCGWCRLWIQEGFEWLLKSEGVTKEVADKALIDHAWRRIKAARRSGVKP